MAKVLIEKAKGHNFKALDLAYEFFDKMGKHEIYIERYYDHGLACRVMEHITTNSVTGIILD